MAQIDVNELRKLFSENTKKRQKADFARKIAKEKEKQQIKEATAKPPTKQQRMEAEVKKLKTQDELNKLTGRGKPEEGADAVDRLLDEYKKARGRAYDKEGEPLLPGQMEEKTIIRGRRSIPLPGTDRVIPVPFLSKEIETDTPGYDPKGKKGSTLRIANERIDELRDDLDLAQKAKEQGITMQEAKRNQDMQKKYEEFLKVFDRPGVDKRRSDYLARLSTQSFFRK
tara:strand:+ start:712 stop:1392 length:681 start_codon:yes stop_codon:yes gene_type:complete